MYSLHDTSESAESDSNAKRVLIARLSIFIAVFVCVAGGGLLYDYSRSPVYRATSRVAVEPPGVADDAMKIQFALNEAQAIRRSDLMQMVAAKLRADSATQFDERELERSLDIEHVPQTSVIELRGEGPDRRLLINALAAWIEAYTHSRRDSDRAEETDALDEAKHALRVAQKAVEDKQREMDAFRQRHGIVSAEREENPSAARLKALHTALNEAVAREVKAEARFKAVQDSLAQGQGVIRPVDKAAIANLEMRAVELRERMKDLEHDYTQSYLALDPKYKALKANLSRVEQQIEQEKERSRKSALIEAQEELAGAQLASRSIRQQGDSLKAESQAFSTRFVELKRMSTELEQLQDVRRSAFERQTQLESARKPSTVRIRVLSAPSAAETPIAPDYSRDAAIALAAGLALAIISVWLHDYLRRDVRNPRNQASPSVIQIAYPLMQPPHPAAAGHRLSGPNNSLLSAPSLTGATRELTQADVSALWTAAPGDARLLIAAFFAGVAPQELGLLRRSHVDLGRGVIHVPGPSARDLLLVDPLRGELSAKLDKQPELPAESLLFADGVGNALDESSVDGQIACVAHDAGIWHPEEVTARCLQFTYAAYLARQGIRMVDLAATTGRITGALGVELMRLVPPGMAISVDRIERVFPGLRATSPQPA